jgi:hypothetical protein
MTALPCDATTAILRAVRANLLAFGGIEALVLEEIRSRSWASVTFSGARHVITFRLSGPGCEEAADAFLTALDVAEFEMRGHLMADIALVSRESLRGEAAESEVRISLEALTVEDC